MGANATAAPISHAAQTNIARAHATTPVVMATSATTVLQTVPRVNTVAAAVEPVLDRVRAAQTSPHTRHTPARAPSTRTIAAGGATPHIIIVVASATAAPTRAVAQISTAQAHAITRVATATNATAVRPIVQLVNIVEDVVERVLARVGDAPIGPQTRRTRVRVLSTQTTAAGDATPPSITAAVNATAAPTKVVAQINIVQARATTRAATDIGAILVRPTVQSGSIVAAAAVRVRARVLAALTDHQTPTTQARAPSTRTIAAGDATRHTTTVVASATAAPTSHAAQISIARVPATTRAATAINAITARLTAPQVNIVAAAAARVLAHVEAVRMDPLTPTTRVRALLTRAIATGCANLSFTIPGVNASAVRISHAVQISIARDHVVT